MLTDGWTHSLKKNLNTQYPLPTPIAGGCIKIYTFKIKLHVVFNLMLLTIRSQTDHNLVINMRLWQLTNLLTHAHITVTNHEASIPFWIPLHLPDTAAILCRVNLCSAAFPAGWILTNFEHIHVDDPCCCWSLNLSTSALHLVQTVRTHFYQTQQPNTTYQLTSPVITACHNSAIQLLNYWTKLLNPFLSKRQQSVRWRWLIIITELQVLV